MCMTTNPFAALLGIGTMPVARSGIIRRTLALQSASTVARWTVVATGVLLAVYADFGEVAARGFYSNFGPWSNHTQAGDISAVRRNERRITKPLPQSGKTHGHRDR
jgi:hypothetical protein